VRKAIAALHATLAAGDAARMARLEDAFDAFAKATAVINSGAGLVAGGFASKSHADSKSQILTQNYFK
jgi:hypothetical protein